MSLLLRFLSMSLSVASALLLMLGITYQLPIQANSAVISDNGVESAAATTAGDGTTLCGTWVVDANLKWGCNPTVNCTWVWPWFSLTCAPAAPPGQDAPCYCFKLPPQS